MLFGHKGRCRLSALHHHRRVVALGRRVHHEVRIQSAPSGWPSHILGWVFAVHDAWNRRKLLDNVLPRDTRSWVGDGYQYGPVSDGGYGLRRSGVRRVSIWREQRALALSLERAIEEAFGESFRWVMFIGSILALLSSIVAMLTTGNPQESRTYVIKWSGLSCMTWVSGVC